MSAFAADVVFVADGGKGGGTIVVSGPLSLVNSVCPAYSGEILITSLYDDTDYRRTNGAKMIFADKNANPISLGGDTTFDNIILEVMDNRARNYL